MMTLCEKSQAQFLERRLQVVALGWGGCGAMLEKLVQRHFLATPGVKRCALCPGCINDTYRPTAICT